MFIHMDEIIKIKLKRDLLYKFNHEIYDKHIVLQLIEERVNDLDINFTRLNFNHYRNRENDTSKCKARLWNDKYGGQCSHKRILGDYCKKHSIMLHSYKKLPFGSIDEPRPRLNLITNDTLQWYDMNNMEQLQIFCNIHNKKIIESLIINGN